MQADARCPSCKKQFKQQRQQCRLKDDLKFNLRISREFRFIQFVCTVRDILNKICKTASNFEILSAFSSLSLKYANAAISRCCFRVTFCKQRWRNEQSRNYNPRLQITNSQRGQKNESPAKQKDNDVSAISSPVVSRKLLRLSKQRASNTRGRTGYNI